MQRKNNITNKVSDEEMLEVARSLGLNYQETIERLAKTTGGHRTHLYSDTDIEEVKNRLREKGKVDLPEKE